MLSNKRISALREKYEKAKTELEGLKDVIRREHNICSDIRVAGNAVGIFSGPWFLGAMVIGGAASGGLVPLAFAAGHVAVYGVAQGTAHLLENSYIRNWVKSVERILKPIVDEQEDMKQQFENSPTWKYFLEKSLDTAERILDAADDIKELFRILRVFYGNVEQAERAGGTLASGVINLIGRGSQIVGSKIVGGSFILLNMVSDTVAAINAIQSEAEFLEKVNHIIERVNDRILILDVMEENYNLRRTPRWMRGTESPFTAGVQNGNTVYIIRALVNGHLVPGMLVNGQAKILLKGKQHVVTNFEIFIPPLRRIEWRQISGLARWDNALVGGGNTNSDPYYIARVQPNEQTYVVAVNSNLDSFTLSCNGVTTEYTDFEVLCYAEE